MKEPQRVALRLFFLLPKKREGTRNATKATWPSLRSCYVIEYGWGNVRGPRRYTRPR
jgi:hypothetical protein